MSDHIVHRMPYMSGGDGVVPDRTPCCAESSRGLVVSPYWNRVTCLTRLSPDDPRPSCEHCGRRYIAIEDAELCNASVWLLGPDCTCHHTLTR